MRHRIPERATFSGCLVVQGQSVAALLLTHGHGTGATMAVGAFVLLYGINGVLAVFVTAARRRRTTGSGYHAERDGTTMAPCPHPRSPSFTTRTARRRSTRSTPSK